MKNSSVGQPSKGSFLFSVGIALSLFATLAYRANFWSENGIGLIPPLKITLPITLLIMIAAALQQRANGHKMRIEPWGCLAVLALLFFTDWLTRSYNLLQGPSIRGEIILFALLTYALLRRERAQWISLVMIIASVILISSFFLAANGRLLFSDDHAVFLYRLQLLKSNFPNIPFFEPRWNAGTDARDFFATGSLNFFFILAPFIYSFPIDQVYNILVSTVLFVLCPGFFYLAARIAGLSNLSGAIGATLAITGNLLWYRWALQYGTMGFMTALSLIPFNLVLTEKILSPTRSVSRAEVIVFAITFSLMLMWTPSGLLFIPAILWALFKVRTLIRKKYLLPLALFILAANLPWILVFWQVSNVSKFVSQGGPSYSRGYDKKAEAVEENREIGANLDQVETQQQSKLRPLSLSKSWQIARENAVSLNPLIIFACLPGFYLLRRSLSIFLGVTSLWILLIGCGISPINPRLEFERLLVILAAILALPAGACLGQMFARFKETAQGILKKGCVSLAGGFLMAGVFSSASVLLNRSLIPYSFAKPEVKEMCETLPQWSRHGRVLFTGVVLHELSGGHLAPLVNLCGGSLMASSHVHNVWQYKQLIPKEFIGRGDEGKEEFFDLMNVESVVAHEAMWRQYFSERPEKYEKVWQNGVFTLFRRNNFKGSYFLEGGGENFKENINSVTYTATTPSAVIKYNYFPFLQSSQCKIAPKNISPNVTLIELTECKVGDEVKISSVSIFKRMLGGS